MPHDFVHAKVKVSRNQKRTRKNTYHWCYTGYDNKAVTEKKSLNVYNQGSFTEVRCAKWIITIHRRCDVLFRMQWSAGRSLLCRSPCSTERMLGLWTNWTRNRCDWTRTNTNTHEFPIYHYAKSRLGAIPPILTHFRRRSDHITDALVSLHWLRAGASIPMGQGGHVPPIFGPGGHDHECPPNISRVISATFYPCNIFLISWKSF